MADLNTYIFQKQSNGQLAICQILPLSMSNKLNSFIIHVWVCIDWLLWLQILNALGTVYGGDIDKVDIWPGGLLETTANGPGPLFRKIILDQFVRTRDGDRFWFENEQNG